MKNCLWYLVFTAFFMATFAYASSNSGCGTGFSNSEEPNDRLNLPTENTSDDTDAFNDDDFVLSYPAPKPPRQIRIFTATPSDIRVELPVALRTKKVMAHRKEPGLEVVVLRDEKGIGDLGLQTGYIVLYRNLPEQQFNFIASIQMTEAFRPPRLLTLRTAYMSYIIYGDRLITFSNHRPQERLRREMDWSRFDSNGRTPYPDSVAVSKEMFMSPLGPMLVYLDVDVKNNTSSKMVFFHLETERVFTVDFPKGKFLSLPKFLNGYQMFVLENTRGRGLAFHRYNLTYDLHNQTIALSDAGVYEFKHLARDEIRDYAITANGEYIIVFNSGKMQTLELDNAGGFWSKPYFVGFYFGFGENVYDGHFTDDSHLIFNNGYGFRVEIK